MYTKSKYQASVPFTLSAIGYGLGLTYLTGLMDTSATKVCTHKTDGRVSLAECGYGDKARSAETLADPNIKDKNDIDPRSGAAMLPYLQTKGDYSPGESGKDFDGKMTGVYILIGTYVVTTAIGAVWSGSNVAQHNDQVRKDIESTVQKGRTNPSRVTATPLLGYDGDRGIVGVNLSF